MSVSLLMIHRVDIQTPAGGGTFTTTASAVPARVEKAIQEAQITYSGLGVTDLIYFDQDYSLTTANQIVFEGHTYAAGKFTYDVGNVGRIWAGGRDAEPQRDVEVRGVGLPRVFRVRRQALAQNVIVMIN